MRPNKAATFGAAGAALAALVAVAISVRAAPPDAAGELDAARHECIAVAQGTQRRERALGALEHEIDLLRRDVGGRQRDLDESRPEQAHLLGALAFLARNPRDTAASAPGGAIERSRSELLLQATLPTLRDQARALSSEIERIAVLREQIAARSREVPSARQALEADRAHLAELVAHRLDLTRRLRPEEADSDPRIVPLGREASDLGELIKRADAATERRDKEVLAAARAAALKPPPRPPAAKADASDPTRPPELHAFDPPHSVLMMPIAGAITRSFGAEGAPMAAGGASQGVSLAALPGAEAVAPFDGRVIYAGPFQHLGLVLIIRHGNLYHSLLAGMERVEVTAGQWVMAGEPVGAMPDAPGGVLYFELRRDSRPVDPQPWLTSDAEGRDQGRKGGRSETDGDQKVRE